MALRLLVRLYHLAGLRFTETVFFAPKGLLRGEPQIFGVRLFVRASVRPCVRPCVRMDHQICNIALKEANRGPKTGS